MPCARAACVMAVMERLVSAVHDSASGGKMPQRFERRIDPVAAKRLEAGDQRFHVLMILGIGGLGQPVALTMRTGLAGRRARRQV